MCRSGRDGPSKMSGEVKNQRAEEEGGNEPSSPGEEKPEPAMTEHKDTHLHPCPFFLLWTAGSFSGSDHKLKRQDIKSDPTPLGTTFILNIYHQCFKKRRSWKLMVWYWILKGDHYYNYWRGNRERCVCAMPSLDTTLIGHSPLRNRATPPFKWSQVVKYIEPVSES